METAHTQRVRGAAEARRHACVWCQMAALSSHRIQEATVRSGQRLPPPSPAAHRDRRRLHLCAARTWSTGAGFRDHETAARLSMLNSYLFRWEFPRKLGSKNSKKGRLKILAQPFLLKDAPMVFASFMHAAPDQWLVPNSNDPASLQEVKWEIWQPAETAKGQNWANDNHLNGNLNGALMLTRLRF